MYDCVTGRKIDQMFGVILADDMGEFALLSVYL